MTLADVLRQAFGWAGPVVVTDAARGAMGRVRRVEAVGSVYALKELLVDPPSDEQVRAEVAFVRRAVAAGVRAPLSHADRGGRYLVPGPDGELLRLYDWVELRPFDLAAEATPAQVGAVLARLHAAAPPAGEVTVDPWYERPPPVSEFDSALAAARAWTDRLARCLATVPGLVASVAPADPARLVTCHRDLHPGNILAGADGQPVVIDWDNCGPADPARELAHALFDWWCDPEPDLPAMRAMYDAYVRSCGPARLGGPGDFTTLVAVRLNFLLLQLNISIDTQADPAQAAWAEQEIDEALRILPRPADLSQVLDLLA